MEYSVFSDESYITAERYRSIGAVSFPKIYEPKIVAQIQSILSGSNVKEFKWQKLKNAKNRFCAEKLIDFLFEIVANKSTRVDILIWDTQDARHNIVGRDDNANFARMFFHLMRNLMQRRELNSDWYVAPDENLAIDWVTIQDCLTSAGKWRQYFNSPLLGNELSEQFFRIREFEQAVSEKTPLCQIADLLAGLAVFSKNYYEKYCMWRDSKTTQQPLFGSDGPPQLSKAEDERFRILDLFVRRCKDQKLGVSLDTNCCLYTYNPNNPINFWHYVPQHYFDKAPVRNNIS